MKLFKRIIISVIILIVVAFLGATWYFSGQIIAFAPSTDDQIIADKKFHDLSAFGVTPEEVTFTTRPSLSSCTARATTGLE
jgi:hypothetical protein